MNLTQSKKQLPGSQYIYGDCGKLIPLKDDSVDFIYSIECLPFVFNRAKFFEEAFRILRGGGWLCVDQHRYRFEFGKHMNIDVVHEQSKKTTLTHYLEKTIPSMVEGECETKLTIRKPNTGDKLKLRLEYLEGSGVHYGNLFGIQYEGYIQNIYRAL